MTTTRFDMVHEELVEWINDTILPLVGNHRGALHQTELKKVEEEVVEFLRDPCADEAIDVIFALWGWASSGDIDLSRMMSEKLAMLKERTWELRSDGSVHHVDNTDPAHQFGTNDCTLCHGNQPFVVCDPSGKPCQVPLLPFKD